MSDVRRVRYNGNYIIWQDCRDLWDGSRGRYISCGLTGCTARGSSIAINVRQKRTKVAVLKPSRDRPTNLSQRRLRHKGFDFRSPRPAAFLWLGLATWTRNGRLGWIWAAGHILPDAGGGILDHCRADVPSRRNMRIELCAGDCHHPRNRLGIAEQRPSYHRLHHAHLAIRRAIVRRVTMIAAPGIRMFQTTAAALPAHPG